MPPTSRRAVTLRPWQREALELFTQRRPGDFLTVACPGAGKTTFALAAARRHLDGEARPIVVVAPTQHLKRQWAEAALAFGFHLDPQWSGADRGLASDMHGVVVTYSQAQTSGRRLRRLADDGMVILDEIHHAADERAWGDGVRSAFETARCRLLLSGTPFRSDDRPIPFVQYSFGDYGDAQPDYEYGYGEALADGGVVRPVFFPRFDGHMEWVNSVGDEMAATFEDELARAEWGARLRTALSLEGNWLPTVLDHAHQRLVEIRRVHPEAGGLVIATDHTHARGIAGMLEHRHGIRARVALSDDPKASEVIAAFAAGEDPWIVAVRMISEGVDIPRLRVGVFATTTTTPMFFRQAVGRIARWTPGMRSQRAFLYLPDDLRLRTHAVTVAEQRRHSIEARRRRHADEADVALDDLARPVRAEEQISLFAALSSTVLTEATPGDGIDPDEDLLAEPEDLEGWSVDLPPPPPLPGRGIDTFTGVPGGGPAGLAELRTRRAEKGRLRDLNAERARMIVHATGRAHGQVNGELNRLAGIDRIGDATVTQLEKRLAAANRWLESLSA